MSKINKKIYDTIDFQIDLIMLARAFGVFLVSLVMYVCLLIFWFVAPLLFAAIIQCGVTLGFVLWYTVKLIRLMNKSNEYTYCETSEFNIAREDYSISDRLFAINVIVDGGKYTSARIVSAKDFARAEELKKIEIGILEQNGKTNIVVVKPNQEF